MTDDEPLPSTDPARPPSRATTPLRLVGYAAVLVALAFSQAGGRTVADTKFDLVTDPARFLSRGLRLWDPVAAFGQVQNQAYGYAWPMGPFFVLGKLAHLPEWAVQRAWWSLLLCLAFFGILRLAQRLGIGTPGTQVVAAFAFVLTPRITTLLGGTSVEIWPMALAPWVLLPLVRGADRGSVRRAAATSALLVACCGGVNAVAVAAVLPLGVIWIVTREKGPRRWRLFAWWTGLTVLATAWWWGPLLVLGRYSPPFLDYIENATITTVPTDAARSLIGISDWVAYFAGFDYPAGRQIVATPFLVLDAAAIVALGLLGICLRRAPHQRFLALGVLTGVALVGLGYAADLHGFFAADRQAALDQALAPLRNLHKFDVVLRIPLVLGVAHGLSRVPALLGAARSALPRRVLLGATALVLVGLVVPWADGTIAPSRGAEEVPGYWGQVASYLHDTDDGSVSLEVPATAFGVYTWGNTHDDVMQGLARSPWAVRNVVPLAQPGNVVMLDRVTRAIESGHPSPGLASYLAANGVGRLLVRNDLDRLNTGAPDPAYVRGVLASSPGISLARSFGPRVGDPAYRIAPNGSTRLVQGDGMSARVGSVDVYDVRPTDRSSGGTGTLTTGTQPLVGDPGSGLGTGLADVAGSPQVLAADADGGTASRGQVLTDDMRRREMNFSAVRANEASTAPPGSAYRLVGPEHDHRVVDDEARWQTTEVWTGGVVNALSSTSQAYADAIPPLEIGSHPGAALDGDPATAWASARHLDPTGQWWQADFDAPRTVTSVRIRLAVSSAAVKALRITVGGRSVTVAAPDPGDQVVVPTALPPGRSLRVTAAGADLRLPGSFALAEVRVAGLSPQRYLSLPAPLDSAPVDTVALERDPQRLPCVLLAAALTCNQVLAAPGEDGDTLARLFRVSTADSYRVAATASLRRGVTAGSALQRQLGVGVVPSRQDRGDVATSAVAMVDDDPATTWLARGSFPRFTITLPARQRLRTIRMTVNAAAPASRPSQLLVRSGDRSAVVPLDADGVGTLPRWDVQRLDVTVRTTERAFRVDGRQFVEAPAGVSSLRVNGRTPNVTGAGGTVSFACGSGPQVRIGGRLFQTGLEATPSDLLRGRSVPLDLCQGDTLGLDQAPTVVLSRPTTALRVDSVTLTRSGATPQRVAPVAVRRDADGSPVAVSLPARTASGVLSLPQNLNAGWRATLDGRVLAVQRVDGWKQGWTVPAGAAGEVRLDYTPGPTFRTLLVLGGVLLLLVLLAATPLRLRFVRARPERLPGLGGARPGLLDLGTVLVVGGLLAGWIGLVGAVLAVLAGLRLPRLGVWGPVAATTTVVAGLGLTWSVVKERSWAVDWTQAWSLLALAMVVVVLAAARRPDPGGDAEEEPAPDDA